ncbi:UNVERIFIED_CONTAM: hypothetical protein GTU68_052132 [Idotea baltica]|nr:hypothetical protein [Idotea baltica]
MPNLTLNQLHSEIVSNVHLALKEDVGPGDLTVQLIPRERKAHAKVITREPAIICGTEWVNEVFRQLDPDIEVNWLVKDGDQVESNQTLFQAKGSAQDLLTGERCALNFLQLLSGTATHCKYYADLIADIQNIKLLDTRKTVPGLRLAQKYAVTCGGCHNHRIGLFDAFLIKENHILACGSISAAINKAREISTKKTVEIEVENLKELREALDAKADIIMLDELSLEDTKTAVALNNKQAKLEASGSVNEKTLRQIAQTGVDYISIGSLTKNIKAIDLSMRLFL